MVEKGFHSGCILKAKTHRIFKQITHRMWEKNKDSSLALSFTGVGKTVGGADLGMG